MVLVPAGQGEQTFAGVDGTTYRQPAVLDDRRAGRRHRRGAAGGSAARSNLGERRDGAARRAGAAEGDEPTSLRLVRSADGSADLGPPPVGPAGLRLDHGRRRPGPARGTGARVTPDGRDVRCAATPTARRARGRARCRGGRTRRTGRATRTCSASATRLYTVRDRRRRAGRHRRTTCTRWPSAGVCGSAPAPACSPAAGWSASATSSAASTDGDPAHRPAALAQRRLGLGPPDRRRAVAGRVADRRPAPA